MTNSQYFTAPSLGKPFEFNIYLSVFLYSTSSHALHSLLLVTEFDEANTGLFLQFRSYAYNEAHETTNQLVLLHELMAIPQALHHTAAMKTAFL
jgi:hypothetical protein